jgi:hypothetical protein
MADKGFNGTTVIWSSVEDGGDGIALGPLMGCDDESTGAEVKVTGSGAALQASEVGLTDETVTIQFVGSPADTDDTAPLEIAAGQKGEITIVWNDGVGGGQGSITGALLTNVQVSGSLDGPITGSVTVRRNIAEA